MTSIMCCMICTENYKKNDENHCTSCGHIFHYHCLEQWLTASMSRSCPQCRTSNITSHKIFLDWEDVAKLNETLSEAEHRNIEKGILANKLAQSESNFRVMSSLFKEHEEKLKNYFFENQIQKFKIEAVEEKIKVSVLEKKEIEATLNEKIKELQNKIEEMILKSKNIVPTKTKANKCLTKNIGKEVTIKGANNSANDGSTIIIKGVTEEHLKMPKELVLKMAQQMNITCSLDDIEDISQEGDKRTLVVEFKTVLLKAQFLCMKSLLKNNVETSEIIVQANNDLYDYVKKLKSVGYQMFYIKNKSVFAKKNKNSPSIRILNKGHVDIMIASAQINDEKKGSTLSLCESNGN